MGTSSLQHFLLSPATTSNNTNHGTVLGGQHFLGARGQLNTGAAIVGVVGDNLETQTFNQLTFQEFVSSKKKFVQ